MRQLNLSSRFSQLLVFATVAMLSACGGGDGGDSIKSPDIPGAEIQAVSVTCVPSVLSEGQTGQCTATARVCRIVEVDDDEFERQCPTEDVADVVKWRSVNPDVVTVDDNGVTTGVGPGTTDIVAKLDDVSGRDTIMVPEADLVAVSVTCPSFVFVGYTGQCEATGTYDDGNQPPFDGPTGDLTAVVDWESSKPAAATVSNDNGEEGLVTGVEADPNPDTVTITATESGSGLGGMADVEVRELPVLSLMVAPEDSSLDPDAQTIPPLCSIQYEAEATFQGIDADGNTITENRDVTTDSTWSPTAGDTTVDQTGYAIGGPQGTGPTDIMASFTDAYGDSVADTTTLSIEDTALDTTETADGLCVEPADSEVTDPTSDITSPVCNTIDPFVRGNGVTVRFQAKLIYESDSVCPLNDDGRTLWSSNDTTLATVEDNTVGTVQTDANNEGTTTIQADFTDPGTATSLSDTHPLTVSSDPNNTIANFKVLPEFSCVGFYDAVDGLQDSEDLPGSQQMRGVGKYSATGWSCDVDGDGDTDGDQELDTQDFSNNPERCAGDLTDSSTWTLIRGYYDRNSDTCIRTDESIPDEDVPGGNYSPDGSVRLGVNCIQGVPDADTSLLSAGTVVVLPVTNDFLVDDGAQLCEALQPLLTVGDGALLEVVSAVANTLDPALVAIFNDETIPIDSILDMVLSPLSDELTSQLIGDGGPLEVLVDTLDDTYGQLNCLIGGVLDLLLGGNSECQL